MAVHYLFRANIEAKARAKPKEGLGTCFSLFSVSKFGLGKGKGLRLSMAFF
jgi:hypothetical protein